MKVVQPIVFSKGSLTLSLQPKRIEGNGLVEYNLTAESERPFFFPQRGHIRGSARDAHLARYTEKGREIVCNSEQVHRREITLQIEAGSTKKDRLHFLQLLEPKIRLK